MSHIQTQTEWEQDICGQIFELLRDDLYLDFRYLDLALSTLIPTPSEQVSTFATDGVHLFFSAEQMLRLYQKNPLFLNRNFLHNIFHCLFRHLWMRGKRDIVLWSLACDISVEYLIDSFDKRTVKRALSWIRMEYYRHLREDELPVTAPVIYRDLLGLSEKQLEKFRYEFHCDDHRYWPKEEQPSAMEQKAGQNWEKIARRAEKELETRGQEEADQLKTITTQIAEGKHRRTYREFLNKFTVLREELHMNEEEFDLNFYTYGLSLYKNMPLIEPLESREVLKISEFVIVIDTSYSTNGALVQKFLEETFSILRQRDHFFKKSRIHILQCDNQLQSDTLVDSAEAIDRYLRQFSLIGGGGTDFRPAFSYVNGLIETGQIKELKGLLYFTDGKGIYPRKRPSYETAFLFMNHEPEQPVPPWAMTFILKEEDLIYEYTKSKGRN